MVQFAEMEGGLKVQSSGETMVVEQREEMGELFAGP